MFNQSQMKVPDFEEFKAEMEQQIFSGDELALEKIIDELEPYDIYDIISRISSLNLIIENQNKSILLDALIAGILTRPKEKFNGQSKMSNSKFRTVINRLESIGLKLMLDPVENTFVERVRYYGNYWIFPGINFSPSHCLQGFLDVLCLRKIPVDREFSHKAHQLINFVLQISDSIAQTLGYGLDSIKHEEHTTIKILDSAHSEKLKNCVYIDNSFIQENIKDKELYELLFIDFKDSDLSRAISGGVQDFFAHPFLKVNENTAILLNPSILIPFAIHQIILLADKYNCKALLINSYNDEIWRGCKKDLQDLGHRKIKETEYGIELINNQHRKEVIMSVGNNKLLFVHFICDSGDNYGSDSMFGHYEVVSELPECQERVKSFIHKLPLMEEDNMFQLVILNSFGRTVAYEMSQGEPSYSISLSPYELHCVSVNERDKDVFIPRYIAAKKKLSMMIPQIISELNPIEMYTNKDYSFYFSDDYNPQNMQTYFAPGDSVDYVIRAVKNEDRHLVNYYDGIHLREVFLNDPMRNIYFAKGTGKTSPEMVIKFNNINIWITFDTLTAHKASNVFYTIVDTVSYWLAEAKKIVNTMPFNADTLRVHIKLSDSAERYYELIEEPREFLDSIEYLCLDNTIEMIWHPEAFQLLSVYSSNAEKLLLRSILEELSKLCQSEIEIPSVDALFNDPLRRKVYGIDVTNSPFMVPTGGTAPYISAEEENSLLDEIGAHFLALPDYDYGRVPDDKRAKLTNEVVGYLYSLLQNEIASIKPDGVYEQVYFDLETVLQKIMIAHHRYAYDAACYPEKAETILQRYNETNRTSLALKFLAEYIAATPPSGEKILGTMQYDRILAICSLIIDWAYKNDLFVYHVFNTPVNFLKSGRIGMTRTEGNHLSNINEHARNRRIERFSDPRIQVFMPSKPLVDFQEQIDDAFLEEYGFTYNNFLNCIQAIDDYGDTIRSTVKRVNRVALVNYVAKECEISVDVINSIIDLVSLSKRNDFLVPPTPFKKYDVYPWRFNRELSFTRRPLIEHNDDLIWGSRQLQHMLRFTLELMLEGKYKARSPKLKKLIGKLSDIRGNEFNSVVFNKIKSFKGLIVREKLSKINGKKIVDNNGKDLGDIDVFYIVPEKKTIVVGEVKDFSFAKNPYEMDQEYNRLFVDGEKPCYMSKHKRRAKWINEHLEDVKVHFNLAGDKWTVKPVMFVSDEIVSNAVYHQNEKIIVYSQITEKLIKSV